jgi:flagellar motor component MotA
MMADREQWKSRIRSAAREAKRVAIVAGRQADALMKVAQQRVETMARRRKAQQRLRQASRVLKTAGRAALAAGAVAAVAAIAREVDLGRKRA